MIDYHVYRLWQSFLPVRLAPHNRLCGSHLAPLAKCRDKKTARGDGAVLYEVIRGLIFVFFSALKLSCTISFFLILFYYGWVTISIISVLIGAKRFPFCTSCFRLISILIG